MRINKQIIDIRPQYYWERIKLWAGGKEDFWLAYSDQVAQFAREEKLMPVATISASGKQLRSTEMVGDIEEIYGGMRVPHLHYQGKVFVLNAEQWNRFSGEIIKDFSKKLAKSKTVSFEQFLELADTMGGVI
jgi:hypothetical protein